MRHATILTIEDQDDIRRLIRMTLEFKGYRVLEAEGGARGLEMARHEHPDLILLDVMMPGVNGLTVGRTLSVDPALQHIPVIMISALGAERDVEAGLATGVHAYLIKPFSPWELLDRVAELLARPEDAAPQRPSEARPA